MRLDAGFLAIALGAAIALVPSVSEASDFTVLVGGAAHVVQGYDAYLRLGASLASGTSGEQLDLAVSGLPAGATASFPDLEATCCGPTTAWRLPINTALHVATAPTTPPGTYTLTVSVTEQGTSVTRTGTFELTVDAVPAPVTPAPLDLTPPIPMLAQWESDMTSFGRTHCEEAVSCGLPDSCVWYYDGARVFFQIADHTGDASWEDCAANVESVYRDGYVIPNGGNVPGYRIFPHGLYMDWVRHDDSASRDALVALEESAAFSRSSIVSLIETSRSREVAYNLNAKMLVEDLGETAERTSVFADVALGHLDQWFVSDSYDDRIAPFMVGLTAEALIGWHERTGDPRVVPALENALDWLWDNAWIAADESFWYEWQRGGSPRTDGAPDLNGLIAPAYAWLYRQTGDVRHRDRADAVFAGGVAGAYLAQGKQFSQSYRWTFDYLRWRTTPEEPRPDAGPGSGGDAGGSGGEGDAGVSAPADAGGAMAGDAGGAGAGGEHSADAEMTGGCSVAIPGRAAPLSHLASLALLAAITIRRRARGGRAGTDRRATSHASLTRTESGCARRLPRRRRRWEEAGWSRPR